MVELKLGQKIKYGNNDCVITYIDEENEEIKIEWLDKHGLKTSTYLCMYFVSQELV